MGLFTKWPLLKKPMSAMTAFQSHYSSNLQRHSEETRGARRKVGLGEWYWKVQIQLPWCHSSMAKQAYDRPNQTDPSKLSCLCTR